MELAKTALDCRALDAMRLLFEAQSAEDRIVAVRIAYARGYMDALDEVQEGTPGRLCDELGAWNPLVHGPRPERVRT